MPDNALPGGRALEDCDARDVAREFAGVFDGAATFLERDAVTPLERAEMAALLRRSATLARAWAQFGPTKRGGRA